MNVILLVGAVLGLLSLSLSAFVGLSMSATLSPDLLGMLMSAIHCNEFYGLVIVIIGLLLFTAIHPKTAKRLTVSAWVFTAGVILFSFSIYTLIFTGLEFVKWLTPIGGLVLAVAWGMLGWAACAKNTDSENKEYYHFKKPS